MPDREFGLRRRDGRPAGAARPRRSAGRAADAEAQAPRLRNKKVLQASASAPASIGNVGVGFDILGQAFDAARDRVIAWREDAPGIRLGAVSGLVTSLPDRPEHNTALAAG